MTKTAVRVPAGLHLQSRFFAATAGLWRRLGNLETSAVADEIEAVRVDRPIYVTSLARAGTTIMTLLLESHPDVTSHRYSDFPNVWTPYWRNNLLQRSRRETPKFEERAHQDRIQVSNDSPEAVEEVLWMHFFDQLHDESRSQVLEGSDRNEAFERFYADHIRKLLAARQAGRYLAKGNYNIARLDYLRRLFPDARFVIPVRNPLDHIASLSKQHRLFLQAAAADPRVGRQLGLSGHFEFGPDRTFVHFGNVQAAKAIREAWSQGRETEGWARYWASTYDHLADRLDADPGLREAVFLVSYETLCNQSETVIDALLEHCGLDPASFAAQRTEFSARLSPPDYYQPDFPAEEIELVDSLCLHTVNRLEPYLQSAV